MKKKLFTILALVFGSCVASYGQAVAQIGFGNDVPTNTNFAPIYRYSATSSTTFSRGITKYTELELANAGILPGSIITSLSFYKATTANFVSPITYEMFLGTVPATDTVVLTTENWNNYSPILTSVYSSNTLTLSNTIGWETFNITPFLYTGGTLVLGNVQTMVGNGGATDKIYWQTTNGHDHKIAGVTTSSAVTANLNGAAAYKKRPNIQIGYTPPNVVCNGMPATPIIAASSDSICLGNSYTVSLSNGTSLLGMDFQWQSSTNGFTFNDIAGATSFSYMGAMASTESYRVRVVCPNTNDTAFSNVVTVALKDFFTCYCTSYATSGSYGEIASVSLGGTTNNSSLGCNTYTDFTSTTFIGIKNVPTSFSATLAPCSTTTTSAYYLHVYIDYNQNGSFSDPGELVLSQATTVSGTVNGNITIPATALNGVTGMRIVTEQTTSSANVSECGTYTYGETEDYLINIQNQPSVEAELVSINSPLVTQCSFGNNIEVTVKNIGLDTINSLEFDIFLGGLVIPNISWTGTIAPDSSLAIVVPGVFVFNDGDSLNVTLKNPNGVADILNNNSKGQKLRLALQGSYSIGYGLTDVANHLFADLNAAMLELYSRGICSDTVYFNLKDGVYSNTQLNIVGDYFNYTPGQIVILQSESKDANNLTISYGATGTANNFIVNVDNSRGWGVKHITFQPTGTTYRSAIYLQNESENVLIDSCKFLATQGVTSITGYSVNSAAIRTESSSNEKNVTVTNNLFEDFSVGLYVYGSSTDNETGWIIENNDFRKIHGAGVYAYYFRDLHFVNNRVIMDTISGGPTTTYFMYLSNVSGANISRNQFLTNQACYGLYLSSTCSPSINPFLISNNFFYSSDVSASISSAIRSASSANNNIQILNNSFHYKLTGASYATLYLTSGANFRIQNNNFVNTNNFRIFNVPNESTIAVCNYNNYYFPNGTMGDYNGVNYLNFNDWKSGTGFDANSLNVNPLFNGPDLHTCAAELDGAGINLALITEDIDGEPRTNGIDIGADQFIGSAEGIIEDTSIVKCDGDFVSIGANGITNATFNWTPGNQTTGQISVDDPGLYFLTVTSNCGVFTDSIEVINEPSVVADFDLNGSYGLAALILNNTSNATGYHWDFGDGSTSSETNPYHLYSSDGVYLITMTAYGICDTIVITKVFTAVALDNEEAVFNELRLYPNPTSDQLNIQMPNAGNNSFDIDVLDMTGKVISKWNNLSGSIFTLDVNFLQSGLYQFRIKSNDAMKVIPFIKK